MPGEVRGPEGTENLRRAMLDFRAVFDGKLYSPGSACPCSLR
jgi:hypothetical protein